jgi:hypothetical protein
MKVTYLKRKWRIPEDAEFEIIEVHPEDPSIFVGRYKWIKYVIFAESVKKIRREETFVCS